MTAPSSGNSDNEILWSFDIDNKADKTLDDIQKSFVATQKAVDSFSKSIDDHDNAVSNLDQAYQNADTQMEQMGVIIGVVSEATKFIIEKLQEAVEQVIKFAESTIELRAHIDTLGISMNNVGGNAGYTTEQMAKFEKQLTSKTIKVSAAREALTKLAEAEVDLSKASDLATVAQNAGVIAGISTSEAMDKITMAISRQSPLMLKTLGLNISMTTAYTKYAASIGKTATELNDVEKKQALVNAIIQAGVRISGTAAAAQNTVEAATEESAVAMERLQYNIGGLFQPVYFEKIKIYNSLLEDLNKWLEDNQGSMDVLAKEAGVLFEAAAQAAQPFLMIVGDIFTTLGELQKVYQDITVAFAGVFGEQARKDMQFFWEHWLDVNGALQAGIKLLVLFGGGMAGLEVQAKVLAEQFTAVAELAAALASGDMNKITAAANALTQAKRDFLGKGDAAQQATEDYLKNAIKLMPELVDGYKAVSDAADKSGVVAQTAAQKLEDALLQTAQKLQQLKDNLIDQEMERQIKEQRAVIEDQIQKQWAAEDRERNHQERVTDIMKNAEEQKAQIVQDVSDQKVKIEEDYRKRLQEIQKNFELDSSELARKRDAVGLLALIRQNKRTLDNEKTAYNDRKKQLDDSYKKTIEKLDKSTQDQLKKLEESEAKELESYQRNLDRQKVLKDLHNQWEQEDRDRSQKKALEDIVKFYQGLDGATQNGLNQLLTDWGGYFTQLGTAITDYNSKLQKAVYDSTAPGIEAGNNVIKNLERQYNIDVNGDGVIGQAGLVSQMLAPTYLTASMAGNASRVPAVRPGANNGGVHEIKLSGDVSGMDPYIQRIMVNALLEIERNRG